MVFVFVDNTKGDITKSQLTCQHKTCWPCSNNKNTRGFFLFHRHPFLTECTAEPLLFYKNNRARGGAYQSLQTRSAGKRMVEQSFPTCNIASCLLPNRLGRSCRSVLLANGEPSPHSGPSA